MIIVQMSDIHYTTSESFLQTKLATAIAEINYLEPDIVIIAGDLTENGFGTEYENVKQLINQIRCQKKILTMGNHDSRFTGYLLFEKTFGSPTGVLRGEDYTIVYANTARADKDEGRVGRDQTEFIKRAFEESEKKLNVLVTHHHMIPVPDTGLEQAMVEDAGDTLKVIVNLGVNYVLSGHRHRPWKWTLNDIEFVFTGAVSTIRLRGFFENSYNIIKVTNGKMTSGLKIVGGSLISFEKIISEALV